MRLAAFAVASLSFANAAAAQLADLQPGRNYAAEANFGFDYSEEIDFGDADNDGDMDAIVANGGDGGQLPNRIFINQGGLQGGTLGLFAEETATRFAGFPADRSRDIEFVDFEGDGDLDVFVANIGQGSPQVGEVSRFHANLGGLQGGTVGFYAEQTDLRWGTLVAVPLAQQVYGGNVGPFRDWSCDCDFADLDDDGALDMFFSSYGPTVDGTKDSRIFLNDATGIFHELWPWANGTADTKTHTFDTDLVDLDGDFDIDVVASSRNSQARVYLNNRDDALATSAFRDITKSALIDQGATMNGNSNYDTEYGDLDGDGDFDFWMVSWNGFTDRILRNDGIIAGSGMAFSQQNNWIKNDSGSDENEVDFADFDGDGDLDAFLANFSGTNFLYISGMAQGLDPATTGLYHRAAGTGSIYTQGELPTGTPGGLTTLDGEACDVDNDGDTDMGVANDKNQQNYLYRNLLGVPDVHAPTFFRLAQPADAPNGSETIVHVQVRDNSAAYVVAYYPTALVFSVNGNPPFTLPMRPQGSMQFRGVIPAQIDAAVSFHVESTDLAGNMAVSSTLGFAQGVPSPGAFTNLGGGLAGSGGIPALTGNGTLAAGSTGALDLAGATPLAPALLFLSLGSMPVPFKGGTLAAFPPVFVLPLGTDAAGAVSLPWATWPAGVAPGTELDFQFAVQDAGAVQGVALSTVLQGITP